jgi:sporulation protein YabP
MAYEISSPSPLHHRLQLEGRESLTVSGVEDVVRFDESCIVMTTCAGSMVVTGSELHIGKLTLDGGELHVDGQVDAVTYEDSRPERGSLLQRLFG